MIKPSIFIGSSKEGLAIAKRVATAMNGVAEVKLWANAFDYNSGTFDTLTSELAFYDYAVLIATADDVTISRHKKSKSSRDNILFEFGLFCGGLGRSRVFYIVENGVKLPSDLLGITMPFFQPAASPDHDTSIQTVIDQISKQIADKEQSFNLGFLPSTALAFGYFKNFVERTVTRLLEDKSEGKTFTLDDGTVFKITDLQFTVLIPDDLSGDMFDKVKAKRLRDGWNKLKVAPKDVRDYDFSVDVKKATAGEMNLVDIPLTLNALNESIEIYSKKQHIGKTTKEKVLEQREIKNFKRTLEYLISTSSMARGIVKVEIVNI